MPSILKIFRMIADANRVRVLRLLAREELSVAELQEICSMGQSTISTHLAQLKQAGLVEDRRTGKNVLYHWKAGAPPALLALLDEAAAEIPECGRDLEALGLALDKRRDRMRAYFDALAGRFGREYYVGDQQLC